MVSHKNNKKYLLTAEKKDKICFLCVETKLWKKKIFSFKQVNVVNSAARRNFIILLMCQ